MIKWGGMGASIVAAFVVGLLVALSLSGGGEATVPEVAVPAAVPGAGSIQPQTTSEAALASSLVAPKSADSLNGDETQGGIASSDSFPSPEELVAYGVLPKPSPGRPPTQWGWGEYAPFYSGSGSSIAERLGSFVLYAASEYTNPMSPRNREYLESGLDQESALTLKQLAERLLVPSPERASGFARREIYSMRFEPDTSVKPMVKTETRVWTSPDSPPQQVETPYVAFSSFVTITFEGKEGKETIRLRVRSGAPLETRLSLEDFQLRILE